MKLISFRIKNFRSIVDSGFNSLAHDNITAIIGQNESGKTSILEALKCFSDGIIIDDVLRSDLSLPSVSCAFRLTPYEADVVSQSLRIPDDLKTYFIEKNEVLLTREWDAEKKSLLKIDGEEILNIYKTHQYNKDQQDQNIVLQVKNLLANFDGLELEIADRKKESTEIQKNISALEAKIREISRTLERNPTPEKKEHARLELDRLKLNADQEKGRHELSSQILVDKERKREELKTRVFFARIYTQAEEKLEYAAIQLKQHDEGSVLPTGKPSGWDKHRLLKRKEQSKQKLEDLQRNYRLAKEELLFNSKLTARIFSGMEVEQARNETMQELASSGDYPSQTDLAEEFAPFMPGFELFEDFSSLLPNRIDLDDLLSQNTNSEGFKAARNFLSIAGLDAQFFSQPDNRILKQKIENLNGEITIDFQDYWRQSVGKNNKIKINFELEHYDLTHPDKKGKPFIEFWIKDEKERLYPKQRSRGVRWFLSFYLELKASAKNSTREKILLIDEPGLSLHARAQEDVLKVFEDVKSQLMIIYTTHSPHLIDINKLYRVLAVQRANEEDETSHSLILDAKSLMKASADTLSPIYTLMGARITDQQHIHKFNNVIVEDATSFYLLKAFFELMNVKKEAWFLPAASVSSVKLLANLLLGWKLDFIIVLNDNEEGRKTYLSLKNNIFGDDADITAKKILPVGEGRSMVDLFSTIDFKNHLLKKRVGITESNSEFMAMNEISGSLLAMEFSNMVMEKQITLDDLDTESRTNISRFVNRIEEVLQ